MGKSLSAFIGIVIPILLGVAGLLSMTALAQLLDKGLLHPWVVSKDPLVNRIFTMQAMVFPISLLALALMYWYDKKSFTSFFRSGIRFSSNNNWNLYGPVLAIGFTIFTALLLSGGVVEQQGKMNQRFMTLLPWVVLFALLNAWTEEIFSRFVIVAGLTSRLSPVAICWVSAIIFGIPHYWGTPGNISGVIMTGISGWILCRSVIETRGMGWALVIHFLQDLVIFGAGAMVVAGIS